MELITQLIVHGDTVEDVYSILDERELKYGKVEKFSTSNVDTTILILHSIPWKEIAAIIGSFCLIGITVIKARSKRKVVISYPDSSRVEITGDFTLEEIEKISHPHKQLYVSMYEESVNK